MKQDLIPIEKLPRTSHLTIARLKKNGIHTFRDLLLLYPNRHASFQHISPISMLQQGESVTIQGVLTSITQKPTKRGIFMQTGVVQDQSGSIDVVWFNQRFLTQLLKQGMNVSLAGSVDFFAGKKVFKPEEYELWYPPNQTIHTGRLVPVYPEIYGISSRTLREKMAFLVQHHLDDALPDEFVPQFIREKYNLVSLREAYLGIHFPASVHDYATAHERLGFDELFVRMTASALLKKQWHDTKIIKPYAFSRIVEDKIARFISNLPFKLTSAQLRTINEILTDLHKDHPMNRFVQGDVGSGKTVVSAVAAYATFLHGLKTLYMAPTEILAEQHYATLTRMFADTEVSIGLQTGSKKSVKKTETNTHDIVVGTQALLTESFLGEGTGLVVIDEQHRFGVRQRAMLKNKSTNPHLLTMTATPIPRTVSLVMFGELDMSLIDEMPAGRKPIKTYVVPKGKRLQAYEWIKKQVLETHIQVFIICPLIEESESETMKTIKAASTEFEQLKRGAFPDLRLALLHGRLKPVEKETIMQQFKNKEYDILVSTSVVEVGIDIPNATIMIIEGAERFGLAQLHQLRGRVGRGDTQSHCLLFTSEETESTGRLRFFASTQSGFKLAEYDLKIRGPGDIYGTQQHGYADLRMADITDLSQIKRAKDAVDMLAIEKDTTLTAFPKLKEMINAYQLANVSRD